MLVLQAVVEELDPVAQLRRNQAVCTAAVESYQKQNCSQLFLLGALIVKYTSGVQSVALGILVGKADAEQGSVTSSMALHTAWSAKIPLP